MNQIWDAEKYSADFSFVHEYGNDVMSLVDTENVSTVLDLGCGNGKLTSLFAEKGLSVIGMDGSEEMLKIAEKNYPDIKFICSDATDFALKAPVDAVFSNAVFHWIDESRQLDMMKCVYQALNSRGQFVFEMGGVGNNQLIHSALKNAFEEKGYPYRIPFYFPSIGQYSSLLEKAGFQVEYAVLFERPTALQGDSGMLDWIKMFVQNPFQGIETADRDAILKKAVELLYLDLYQNGVWYADYVRLRMKAIKK